MSIVSLARPEVVAMKPYSSARKEASADGVLLNANEAPWSLLADDKTADASSESQEPAVQSLLNRYPDPQPGELVGRLAELYEVTADQLLVTRGSDEGIDLLTRVFCRAGKDAILHCPPTFGMYQIAAQTQGADVIAVSRSEDEDFRLNTAQVIAAVEQNDTIRLVFLTSPNNPTGDCIETDDLQHLLEVTNDRAIVVVDEAYAEFCRRPSAIRLLERNPHLVVLRTLSKAWASAGLRCGAVLANPEIIGLLGRIIAPYPLASPVAALANRVLQPDLMQRQLSMLTELAANKQRLVDRLRASPAVKKLWPGEANFVLIRVSNAGDMLSHFATGGVILRGYSGDPALRQCIRISVGSKQDLDAFDACLASWEKKTDEF